jgi:uncharacterized protein YoxC
VTFFDPSVEHYNLEKLYAKLISRFITIIVTRKKLTSSTMSEMLRHPNMKESPREIAEIVENAMREINSAMKNELELGIRIGRRTTHVVRFTMIGILLLSIAMFYLISTLTRHADYLSEQIQNMSNHMESMEKNFKSVAKNMKTMMQSVESMNQHISVMPNMNTSVDQISKDIVKMSQDMRYLRQDISIMKVDMANMNYLFGNLNNQFGMMGHNVDRIAIPMKMFPFP